MSLHPSQLPDGRSLLSRPVNGTWPAPDSDSTGTVDRQESALYRSIMWSEFGLVIERTLGGKREYLALEDKEAFMLVMDVVWHGQAHAEAAQDKCRVEDLVERHREYAESGALSTFLMLYPALHHRVSALVQESNLSARRARLRAATQRRGA